MRLEARASQLERQLGIPNTSHKSIVEVESLDNLKKFSDVSGLRMPRGCHRGIPRHRLLARDVDHCGRGPILYQEMCSRVLKIPCVILCRSTTNIWENSLRVGQCLWRGRGIQVVKSLYPSDGYNDVLHNCLRIISIEGTGNKRRSMLSIHCRYSEVEYIE